MKAFLLAGGYGTRLKPITDTTPKCLVHVGGKPLLEHWLEQLVEFGVQEILINTHYLHTQVEEFIHTNKFSSLVALRNEPELLGTMGSIKAYFDILKDSDVIVAHADNYCQPDWKQFTHAYNHRPEGCHMTMMAFETDNPSACGMLKVDEKGVLTGYVEKPLSWSGDNRLANAAIFVLSAQTLNKIASTKDSEIDLCADFLPHQIGGVNIYYHTNVLIDIGTPDNLKRANGIAKIAI